MSVYSKLAAYIGYLMEDTPHTWKDGPALALLSGLSVLYGWGVGHRYRSYLAHPEKQVHLPVPVISLGNITAGGTGKTPTACYLARWLCHRGYKPALLNRGYRSRAEKGAAVMSDGKHILLDAGSGGDEALLMARSLPGVPVLVGRERARTGQMAVRMLGAQVLLLDDAFQHWQLARNLDIVLIDSTNPFGNGHLLPRGILREPMDHLKRAGFFILTKSDLCTPGEKEQISGTLRQYNQTAPVAEAVHQPAWCVSFADWYQGRKDRKECSQLQEGTAAIAVSALGNPASFEATVCSSGYHLADRIRYDDHHPYTAADIRMMEERARLHGAVLVTTEKDAVKLPAADILERQVPLWVLGIEIVICRGEQELQQCILNHIGGTT